MESNIKKGIIPNLCIGLTLVLSSLSLGLFSTSTLAAEATAVISAENDTDNDGVLNGEDMDIDGDGIPNLNETNAGLDPFNPADALEDLDSDSWSNLDEYLFGTDLTDATSNPTGQTHRHQKVFPSHSEARFFGNDAVVKGSTAVISSIYETANAAEALGAAYIFEKNNGVWIQSARIQFPEALVGDYGGTSIGYDGKDSIILGLYSIGSPGITIAYIYRKDDQGVWNQEAAISGPPTYFDYYFGYAVAIEGDRAFIGNPNDSEGSSSDVYYYKRNSESEWNLQQKIQTSALEDFSGVMFGTELALNMSTHPPTLFVGATVDQTEAGITGTVYAYQLIEGRWSETQKLAPDHGASWDYFGTELATNGDTLLVAASNHDSTERGNANTGAVFVFERDKASGEWVSTDEITFRQPQNGDVIGSGIALLSPTLAAIGASGRDVDGNSNSGEIQLYRKTDGDWKFIKSITPADLGPDQRFGSTISASGSTIVVGAHGTDTTGAAYFYNLRTPTTAGN